jgi:tetratricopeptide (TPR) repeat protein
MSKKRFHESAEAFTAVIKIDSESVESLKLRAKCFFELKKFNESKDDCDIGLMIALDDGLRKFFLKLLEKNMKNLQANIQKETRHTTELPDILPEAEEMYEQGQQEFSSMNYIKALEKFKAASETSSFKIKYDLAIAECHLVMENYEKALHTALKIVEHDQKSFQAYIIAIKFCLKLGKTECAENLLKTFDENDVNGALFRDKLNESELTKLKDYQSTIESTFKEGNSQK